MKTRKKRPISPRAPDWLTITISGPAFECGRAHGRALYKQLQKIRHNLSFFLQEDYNKTLTECIKYTNQFVKPVIQQKYPQIYEELRGIATGARERGVEFGVDVLIVWNFYTGLASVFPEPAPAGAGERCCAFIAAGDIVARGSGGIIMAHNSHESFALMQHFHIIMTVVPPAGEGCAFKMQTAAGLVASNTDWFITGAGMMGCETTIGGMRHKARRGDTAPYFCRIRTAMQYGQSLDDYIAIMTTDNMGDYACTWLFGDTKTGEIARVELGVYDYSVEKTKNGYMTSANSVDIIQGEIADDGYNEHATSVAARRAQLDRLLQETPACGGLDVRRARDIISNHGGAANKLSICKHTENDGTDFKPYYPRGAFDGKVVDARMARRGKFWARMGSSCGRAFSMKAHIQKYPQYKYLWGKTPDVPRRKWRVL